MADRIERIPYGSEPGGEWGDGESCPECRAKHSELHKEGCDCERCSTCGGQYNSFGCPSKSNITMSRYEQIMQKVFSMPEDWIHTNEGSMLLAESLSIAPPEIKRMMDAKLKELGLLPKFSFVDDTGQAFCTAESVAKTLGISIEEVNQRCTELKEIHPEHFTPRGELHRIQ